MDFQNEGKTNDYRVNFHNGGEIISIEVTCCGGHIGEIHFKDGEHKKCSVCGTLHTLKLQHNHFHIRQSKPQILETETL
ncbi:hypothetical protein Desor_4291 [Desulfosporosinus orientis DSM 765]|uniref:Uncharacterized protein n=1 Tax=Desulfosporosinus orientis (strain ATCC 19365 / DSM 765 / NCIMB 8382 / VKM B-1628 / Singapore I) TaxID=768706 RepID=G7WIZ7_DESOD|nr:hypothetical protein [Desulfosporosinus orientis]AET69722.1 hypothetical protein Desor_4291 [Desulfosporosinus orientis DSM 765]